MIAFLKIIIYTPLYNLLVLILNIPYVDAGIAAIILTILVKLLLYPIAKKGVVTQLKMKESGKELAEIKEKYKDKQEQALKVMEFYKKNKINPFGSILGIIIQIPIIYSLYHIFLQSGLPTVNMTLLYDFVKAPEVSMLFLGFWDIAEKSLILALLAAVSSYFQMHLSAQSMNSATPAPGKEDLSSMMAKQMKYTFPVIVFFISWKISGVIALYWFVSNLAGIAQDYIIKRSLLNSEKPQIAVNFVSKN